MRVHHFAKSKKPLLIGLAVLFLMLIIGLGASGHLPLFRHKPTSSTEQEAASDASRKQALTSQKPATSSTNSDKASSDSTSTQGNYTPPTNSNGITLSANQSGNAVTISTQLSGYSDGECTLTINNGSQTTTQTAQVIYQPQFSTCAGFSVPISSVGTGTWDITLKVVSAGITTSKSIVTEVN